MSVNPLYPDVPIAAGVPAVLRILKAGPGSLVNSSGNVTIGAAQGVIGAPINPIGSGFSAANGAITNVQNIGTGALPNLVNSGFGAQPVVMTSDSSSVTNFVSKARGQWGIFDASHVQVIDSTSTKSIAFKQDWSIANYPMEKGAFQSYNKVNSPYSVRVEVTKGGTVNDRNAFLQAIQKMGDSIDLFNVVTPEFTYANVSIEGFDYRRNSTNGVTLLTVEIECLEIRIAPDSKFSNTATASGAGVVNSGTVQATAATSAQQSAAATVQ